MPAARASRLTSRNRPDHLDQGVDAGIEWLDQAIPLEGKPRRTFASPSPPRICVGVVHSDWRHRVRWLLSDATHSSTLF